MDETSNLKLPYILAAQSQKHVTHNEALRALDVIVQLAVLDKDLATAPGSPVEGSRYIVAAGATGVWSGHAGQVAAFQDGAWAFYAPVAGWLAWVDDESLSYLFSGGGWIAAPGGGGSSLVPKGAWSALSSYSTGDLVEHDGYAFLSNIDSNIGNEPDATTPGSTAEWTYFSLGTGGGGGVGSVNPVDLVGVNATADTTNRLKVSSAASLFDHDGAGHQLKINKDEASDTGSVLFQTGYSGRAEFGLTGDDDFHVKVSADGSAWHDALVISRSSGAVRGRLPCTAPGGRITLTSGVPVLTSDVAGATTIRYTPYVGRYVPLYDGARFVMADIGGELAQTLSDTSKSPAAAAASSNYDLFVWNDSGTFRVSRGPVWTTATSRGTGAGTTELEMLQGFLVNMRAITNGPAAQRGTYVGTVRTNGSTQVAWSLGSAAAGGGEATLGLWNMYNRVCVAPQVQNTNTNWSYATASWRAANGSSTYRISFVRGINEDGILAIYAALGLSTSNAAQAGWGVGLDTDSAPAGWTMTTFTSASANNQLGGNGGYSGLPGLGWHYVQAIENGATNVVFNGENGKTLAALSAQMRA